MNDTKILRQILEKLESIDTLMKKGSIQFMSPDELSEYLHFKKSTIYKLVCTRKIPYYKPAGKIYFEKTEINNWVLKYRHRSNQEIEEMADEYVRKHLSNTIK